MADHVLIDWQDRMVTELNPTDPIEAFIQGVEIGRGGHEFALYQVNVSPPVQRYPKPAEPASEPSADAETLKAQQTMDREQMVAEHVSA